MFDKMDMEKSKRYTTKIGIVLVCFLFSILISQKCIAHSPTSMELSYDTENQILEVTIIHQVSDPTTHYIYNVEIKKNGVTDNTSDYIRQSTRTHFTYLYNIYISDDDVVDVIAFCNQGGSITQQIPISDETGELDDSGGSSSTSGFEMVLLIISISIVFLISQRRM